MSYPPPPGLSSSSSQSLLSLPNRPNFPGVSTPQSASLPGSSVVSKPSKPSFAPRQIGSLPTTYETATPGTQQITYERPAQHQYSAPPTYMPTRQSAPYQSNPAGGGQTYSGYASNAPLVPHIVNPFPATPASGWKPVGRGHPQDQFIDAELQAQIAEQQSIYNPENAEHQKLRAQASRFTAAGFSSAGNATSRSTHDQDSSHSNSPAPSSSGAHKHVTVVRSGGGKKWEDPSLLEWDPAHFRLFVGNLAGEVTDESLLKAFNRYGSVQKARVVRDKNTSKSKGFGFVSFTDSDDYFQAAREMQGKYIGSHPVLLRKATTEIKAKIVGGKNNGKKGGKGISAGGIKKNKEGRKGNLPKVLG